MLDHMAPGSDAMKLVHFAVGSAVTAAALARATLGVVKKVPGVRAPLDSAIDTVIARGDRASRVGLDIADAVLRLAITKIVAAVIDEVDLTRLIRENVDLDAIIEGVDLDRAVARVDIAAVIDRVDIAAVIDRVDIAAVVDTVDLDRQVARVNLDQAVARVDLDTAISRVDLIALANFVIDGVDLPDIIRESTGSLSAEAVRGVRSQGMQADDAVSHFVGRLFGREPGIS